MASRFDREALYIALDKHRRQLAREEGRNFVGAVVSGRRRGR